MRRAVCLQLSRAHAIAKCEGFYSSYLAPATSPSRGLVHLRVHGCTLGVVARVAATVTPLVDRSGRPGPRGDTGVGCVRVVLFSRCCRRRTHSYARVYTNVQ